MKKLLKRIQEIKLYYYENGKKLKGPHSNLMGDCSNLKGNCSNLRGNCSCLMGDCSNLMGNCSNLWGDIRECEISEKDREKGINIEDLTEEK